MKLKYTISNNEVTITGLKDRYVTEVIIPSEIDGMPVTRIENYAFESCTGLASVTIPHNVTKIGHFAFGYHYSYNNHDDIKTEDFTIYGQKGSAAEYYANVNGFTFINNERKELERKAIDKLNIEYVGFFNKVRIYGNMPLEKQFIFDTVYRYLHDHINLVSMSVLKDIIEQRRYIITLVSDIRTKDLVCSLLDIIETEVSKTLM